MIYENLNIFEKLIRNDSKEKFYYKKIFFSRDLIHVQLLIIRKI